MDRSSRIVKLAQGKFEDQIERLETKVTKHVAFPFAESLQKIDERVIQLWLLFVGDLDGQIDPRSLELIISQITPLLRDDLQALEQFTNDYAQRIRVDGTELGIKQAQKMLYQNRLSLDGTVLALTPTAPTSFASEVLVSILTGLAVAKSLTALRGELRKITGFAQSRAEAAVSYSLNDALNTVKSDAAAQVGASKMWVAERDACLTCLALSGVYTTGSFPESATFADKPLKAYGSLKTPPRHPHCRCQIVPFKPEWGEASDALKREAQRSVLKGWGDSSDPAARRAAERLLDRNPSLARSVKEEAERRLKSESSFRRDVPTG